MNLQAQTAPEMPKLVVVVVIDQLRGDYLDYSLPVFGDKGFKRLMRNGLCYRSVEFDLPNKCEASSVADIFTGASSYYNGIGGDAYFDWEKNREISIVEDENFIGNYTSARVSPLSMTASTIGDELKIASQGQSRVYAIAANATSAVLSAGKYANAAFWLDETTGQWATSTYYKEFPSYIENYNAHEAIGNYQEWQWKQSYASFTPLPYSDLKDPFTYKFAKNDNARFKKMKHTPLLNAEITNLAEKFFDNAGFTRQKTPDMFILHYYAGNYEDSPASSDYNYEIQDIYYRLDKEIEKLLELIERKIGLKRTLIVLTSTGYYRPLPKQNTIFKPAGEFYPNRCTSLLNMYLMAIYGRENWVKGYFDKQIFLNKQLAEEKQIKWNDLLTSAAEFAAQFSGVRHVTKLADDSRLPVRHRGDLLLELQSGWVIADLPNVSPQPIAIPTAPLIFFGENVRKEQVANPVKATQIAPTLSYLLRIPAPNACKERPLVVVSD
jgi:hypothetical protein